MIFSILRLAIVILTAVILAWGIALLLSEDPEVWIERERVALRSAIPEGDLPEAILPSSLPINFGLPPRIESSILMAFAVASIRSRVALRILPIFSLLMISGFVLGLLFRERVRYGWGYASPAAAYLAKHAIGIALLIASLFVFSPVDLSYAALYVTSVSSSIGVTLYVGNLPPKL